MRLINLYSEDFSRAIDPSDTVEAITEDTLDLINRLFTISEAIEWKWPPDVIMRQDEQILDALVEMKSEAIKTRDALKREEGNAG